MDDASWSAMSALRPPAADDALDVSVYLRAIESGARETARAAALSSGGRRRAAAPASPPRANPYALPEIPTIASMRVYAAAPAAASSAAAPSAPAPARSAAAASRARVGGGAAASRPRDVPAAAAGAGGVLRPPQSSPLHYRDRLPAELRRVPAAAEPLALPALLPSQLAEESALIWAARAADDAANATAADGSFLRGASGGSMAAARRRRPRAGSGGGGDTSFSSLPRAPAVASPLLARRTRSPAPAASMPSPVLVPIAIAAVSPPHARRSGSSSGRRHRRTSRSAAQQPLSSTAASVPIYLHTVVARQSPPRTASPAAADATLAGQT